MPGTVIAEKLIRRTSFIYGNNIVINHSSKNPELAFLYAMWFTDPDVSLRSISVISGMADPFRANHIKDQRVWPIYTKQAVDTLEQQARIAVPSGTGLPGDTEYIKALNANLWRAGKGELTAEAAMKQTAEAWEKITVKYGRDKQIRYWRSFKAKFPLLTLTSK